MLLFQVTERDVVMMIVSLLSCLHCKALRQYTSMGHKLRCRQSGWHMSLSCTLTDSCTSAHMRHNLYLNYMSICKHASVQ